MLFGTKLFLNLVVRNIGRESLLPDLNITYFPRNGWLTSDMILFTNFKTLDSYKLFTEVVSAPSFLAVLTIFSSFDLSLQDKLPNQTMREKHANLRLYATDRYLYF
jgi:hypothetical protein